MAPWQHRSIIKKSKAKNAHCENEKNNEHANHRNGFCVFYFFSTINLTLTSGSCIPDNQIGSKTCSTRKNKHQAMACPLTYKYRHNPNGISINRYGMTVAWHSNYKPSHAIPCRAMPFDPFSFDAV